MLPPEEYEQAARNADWHVQVAIEQVAFAPGEATLVGPVVRVFRGSSELAGHIMRLKVGCVRTGEDDEWAPDGAGRFPSDALRPGRILEAFVVDTPEGPEIAADLCSLLDSATDRPRIG